MLNSMTGFARSSGHSSPFHWDWELRSVNSKGLDLRLRLPAGFEWLEPLARNQISKALARGSVQANLTVRRDEAATEIRIDQKAIDAIVRAAQDASLKGLGPLTLDGLFAIRGVVDAVELDNADYESCKDGLLEGLGDALTELTAMRAREGEALAEVLGQRLGTLSTLVRAADETPGRKAEAVRERIIKLVDDLAGRSNALDPARLHQEALLMAAKADVTEEIDRLRTHVAAAQALVQSQGPVGRRLDFLAQELGREANTLCAKSNDAALTTIGIEMRVEIEQFREQVQNIE